MSSDVGVDIIIRDNKPYEGDFSKWHVVQIVFKGLVLPFVFKGLVLPRANSAR